MGTMLAALTDIGKCRKNKEDCASCSVYPFFSLLVCCDGIGGHKKGDVASVMCMNKLMNLLNECSEDNLKSHNKIVKYLKHIVKETNNSIYTLGMNNDKYSGMGTTLVFAIVLKDVTYIVNIGDSRCYIIDYDDEFIQLTKDDNVITCIKDRNRNYTKTIYLKESEKFALTQAIGLREVISPTIYRIENNYKYLFLCTDGLYNMVKDDDIVEIIKNDMFTIKEKVEKLIQKANDNGGKDNIGVSLLEVY